VRKPDQPIVYAGVNRPEKGQRFVADPVAGVTRFAVCGVFSVRPLTEGRETLDFGSSHPEKRPHVWGTPLDHAGHTAETCPPCQPEENRLDLIVGMVTEGHGLEVLPSSGVLQKRPSQVTRRSLGSRALPHFVGVQSSRVERQLQLLSQVSAKRGVIPRTRAQGVIHMSYFEPSSVGLPQGVQEPDQTNRVQSSRHGDQQVSAQEADPGQGFSDLVDED
jgi:hypothetical protein